jgi:methyltransferase
MVVAGILVFLGAKALKYWAVFTLGPRWAYRVLVLPGAPLVTGGPYAWVRHPNYLAVVGEIAGVAMIAGAWMTGPAALAAVGALLRKRVAVEDRALGRE